MTKTRSATRKSKKAAPAALPYETTMPVSQLFAWSGNPRRNVNDVSIDDLKTSILAEGQLQNLVVRPQGDQAEVVVGGRRLRALKELVAEGKLSADHAVKVQVREGLSDEDALIIAGAENLNRSDMSHADAVRLFMDLNTQKVPLARIASAYNYSDVDVRRLLRVGEANVPEVMQALETNSITPDQAVYVTEASPSQRNWLLTRAVAGARVDELRRQIKGDHIPVTTAKFDVDSSGLTVVHDLLELRDPHFADKAAFMQKQQEAAQALAEAARDAGGLGFAQVEVTASFYTLKFDLGGAGDDPKTLGVIATLHPDTGVVTLFERYKARGAGKVVRGAVTDSEFPARSLEAARDFKAKALATAVAEGDGAEHRTLALLLTGLLCRSDIFAFGKRSMQQTAVSLHVLDLDLEVPGVRITTADGAFPETYGSETNAALIYHHLRHAVSLDALKAALAKATASLVGLTGTDKHPLASLLAAEVGLRDRNEQGAAYHAVDQAFIAPFKKAELDVLAQTMPVKPMIASSMNKARIQEEFLKCGAQSAQEGWLPAPYAWGTFSYSEALADATVSISTRDPRAAELSRGPALHLDAQLDGRDVSTSAELTQFRELVAQAQYPEALALLRTEAARAAYKAALGGTAESAQAPQESVSCADCQGTGVNWDEQAGAQVDCPACTALNEAAA